MLTRRENLLIRPWQERRYIHHRLKVKSALPAIDTSPPPIHEHVTRKLKKYQKESDRCAQIISDNFTLLQHLSTIMTTTRVDHFWDEPPPNFLQRVGIYASGTPKRLGSSTEGLLIDEVTLAKTRKEKCVACSHRPYLRSEVVFDERRPYSPPKGRISKRSDTPIDWHSQFKSRCDEDKIEFRGKKWSSAPPKPKSPARRTKDNRTHQESRRQSNANVICRTAKKLAEDSDLRRDETTGSLILSQGELSVAVQFPPRTGIVYRSTNGCQRVLQRNTCECASFLKPKRSNE